MRLRTVFAMFFIGIFSGAFAGYGVVQTYNHSNFLWLVALLPWAFLLIFYGYKIRTMKKKVNEIEINFKGKYGIDINNRKSFDNYLDNLMGNKNNRS